MNVFTMCNHTQSKFHAQWEKSFRAAGMNPVTRWVEIATDGNFMGDGYGRLIRMRARWFTDLCETQYEPFAVSDVDVIAEGEGLAEFLLEALGNHDIAFARENHSNNEVCCGFFVCRPTKSVRNLWSGIAHKLTASDLSNDQTVINRLLPTLDLKWTHLPREVQSATYRCPVHFRIYHANNTIPRDGKTSAELKMEQFINLKQFGGIVAVIAHTDEPLDWLKDLHIPKEVVTSDPKTPCAMRVENSGREAGKWLRWLTGNYDKLPEYVAFLQAGASHHCPDVCAILNEGRYFGHGFYPLGKSVFATSDKVDNAHDMAARTFAESILGGHSSFGRWVAGAQMVVHRARIWRHEKIYFERLLELVEEHPLGPWCIERRWHELL